MRNRTYRYFTGKPLLFAFGHGLSYTKFEYADAEACELDADCAGWHTIKVTIRIAK